MTEKKETRVNLTRHARDCGVCRHAARGAIERAFVAWESPSEIAKAYRLQRSTIYLHAAAMGLTAERTANVKTALANFIERCSRVRPSAAAFVSACIALSKMNEAGQTVERVAVSSSNITAQFAGFTIGELEAFARDGILPEWYATALSATQGASRKQPS